ncbi:MAG: hypothetical protein ACTHXA_10925 [Gulosibacter sp.]|uniref:hypothetical protein n=1 Tax=Gulosibacter sp. TaxID=2817531 RepID=UPI003F8E5AFC
MIKKKLIRALVAFTMTVATFATAASATASEVNVEPEVSELQLFMKNEAGETVEIEWPEMPEMSEPEESDEPQPYLIDITQWSRCFILNFERDTFEKFPFPFNGQLIYVHLRCGTGDPDRPHVGWGYQHITYKHEDDWQAKLNQITPPGTTPDKSWDDVMAAGISVATGAPTDVKPRNNNDTFCAIGEMGFKMEGQGLIQWMGVKVAFSQDGDRVITAYPVSLNSVC